jgi:hypothetical protein
VDVVSGIVRPPARELANRNLIEAHLHAVWLAESGNPGKALRAAILLARLRVPGMPGLKTAGGRLMHGSSTPAIKRGLSLAQSISRVRKSALAARFDS